MSEINVLSVNISEKKGTIKKPVKHILLNGEGVVGDAHSGNWHRQVSLLGKESIDKFIKESNRKVNYGEFAENITTEGITLFKCHPLDRFIIGNSELEVTQIGKKCHGTSCVIFKEVGNCVMPTEGIFCRVKQKGKVQPGDSISYLPKTFRVKVVTLSDRASRGIYEDLSGPRIEQVLSAYFHSIERRIEIEKTIISDDADILKQILLDNRSNPADIIFTTGGTGIGPKDITPDVVKTLLDKEIPGIMEHIRIKYGREKPNALLSRSIAGVMDQTLIYTLPGSLRAVDEYLDEIQPTLLHSIHMLHGLDLH
jgi:molybdopterin adenylyltransferase